MTIGWKKTIEEYGGDYMTEQERLEIITRLTMTTRYSETFLHTLTDEQLKREMERYE